MNSPPNSGGKNEKAPLNLPHSLLSNKIIFIVCMIVVIALIADAFLARTADLFSPTFSRTFGTMAAFTLILIVCFVGQFLILFFVRYRSEELLAQASARFYKTYKVTMAFQIALSILLLLVIFQILVMSYYSIFALIAATATSYALAIAMMALLMKSFLSWFITGKNFLILAYTIAAAILVIHLGFTLFFTVSALLDVPAEIRTAISRTPFFMPGSVEFILSSIHELTSILSFSVLWGATVLLLHHYSQKVGRIKYWILVTLPLVYFLSQFPTLFFNLFNPLINENPIFFGSLLTFIFTLSKPAGGILFGIAFWTIARNIPGTVVIRNYLTISALGFVLLFTSDQAILLIILPYPPFGVAAVSFAGLSSYLIFVGIYYSAISISHDDKVRREIKKFAISESKLLDSIGSAQLEKNIAEKVTAITQSQDSAAQSSGVPSSIDEDEIRKYVEDVLHEIKSVRKDDKEK
jgi:hypothetical protein